MSSPTIVISRGPSSDQGLEAPDGESRRAFEAALVELLKNRPWRILSIPHLYNLTAEHPAARRLNAEKGRLVLVSWLHQRAALWTLRALGIRPESDGDVVCLNAASFRSAQECVEKLSKETAGGEARFEEVNGEPSERWYPVIDYSLCGGCRRCLDYCLFGVYSLEEGRVKAFAPERCKNGCPACARVCPEGAIVFPHYTADAAIAGAPGTKPSGDPIDFAAIAAFATDRAREKKAKTRDACKCDCDCPPGKCERGGECDCDCTHSNDLDELMKELDELDD
jgi:hypothetical protein